MKSIAAICLIIAIDNAISQKSTIPNIILIVTDDQDVVLKGMVPMANVQNLIVNEGSTFTNAFTSSPLCCPSRSSILSGQLAHNHATINNSQSGGCFGQFWRESVESRTMGNVLQMNGLKTFFAGKYLNDFHGAVVPPGWDEFHGLIGNSKYYNYSLNENGHIRAYGNDYLTDVISEKAITFLKSSNKHKFFMMLAPPAPHAPYTPANRHAKAFPSVRAERTPNFNTPSGELDKHWLLTMDPKQLPDELLTTLDEIARKRFQSLLAVDEMVGNIVRILTERNILDNTYIVFTSDNGYHLGQFAQAYDKRQPYETDIRVPLVIRGPNIKPKVIVNQPTLLIDLYPSFLEMIGVAPFPFLDGRSFVGDIVNAQAIEDFQELDRTFERFMMVEHWGESNPKQVDAECDLSSNEGLSFCTVDAACHCQDARNNTYACLRHISALDNLLYCEFRDSEKFVEVYRLDQDFYEMENLYLKMLPSELADYSLKLNELTKCIGDQCKIYDAGYNGIDIY